MTATRLARALVGVTLLAAACVTTRKATVEVVWPDPPETPRIRFVTWFAGSEQMERTAGQKLVQELLGQPTQARLKLLLGLAVSPDGKRLYISDRGVPGLLVADFLGGRMRDFAGREVVGQPSGLAVDDAGNVYAADLLSGTVKVLSPNGKLLRTIGADTGRMLERPTGVALDKNRGLLYVVDTSFSRGESHRVQVFSTGGQYLRELGSGRGDEPGQFNLPTYVSVDSTGRVFVADSMNFRVQVFDSEGNFLSKFGSPGDIPGSFSRMKGLAHGRFDILYIVDGDYGVVQMFNRANQMLMDFGTARKGADPASVLRLPAPIAIDQPRDLIYVGVNGGQPRINVYQLINTVEADAAPDEQPPDAG